MLKLPDDMFWDYTPKMIAEVFRAHGEVTRLLINDRTTLAWQIANFSRYEKLPKLDKFLLKDPKRKRIIQSPEAQLAMAREMNKAFGGTRRKKTHGS